MLYPQQYSLKGKEGSDERARRCVVFGGFGGDGSGRGTDRLCGCEAVLGDALAGDWADARGADAGAGGGAEPAATFYLGMVNGGVWKTTDAGETWQDVWEGQPSGSIGSIAVAESNPNILYVASGEGLQRPDLATGDGVYKSTDAGKTWVHLPGLRDGQQMGSWPSTRRIRTRCLWR